MKKFIVLLFTAFLLIGAVGSVGATSFTIGSGWSHLDGISPMPEFFNLMMISASTFELLHGSTSNTNEFFGNGIAWNSGGIFGGSLYNISNSHGGIISTGLHDNLGWRQRIKKLRRSGDSAPVAPVPEPATLFMVGIGLAALAKVTRKKIKP